MRARMAGMRARMSKIKARIARMIGEGRNEAKNEGVDAGRENKSVNGKNEG